jgi:hypothetical protein
MKWLERRTCPVCHRFVAVYVPRGGDGSGLFFRLHRNGKGSRCDGSKQEAVNVSST